MKKTKVMVTLGELEEFTIADETFEVVHSVTFLGATIHRDGGHTSDIAVMIAMGKAPMTGLYSVMKDRDISILMKVWLVKALVFLVMMYDCESWTIRNSNRRKIDSFELWCWHRRMIMPWTERRTNKILLHEMRPETYLEGMIVKQALTFIRHMIRAFGAEIDVLLGKVKGRQAKDKMARFIERNKWDAII